MYNLAQNIWNKVKKPSIELQNGQNYKALISTFACFLTTIGKV